ncbi:hypothetical protein Busp01_36050 [Trinickia caryophylli]|nr:hypothetical protein Busp01_36050 [Trinickia caryophylli]
MCGVRLQLDYWKTEQILQAHRIEHTVVVYGSTRLIEPDAAQRRLAAAREVHDAAPQDARAKRALRTAERLAASSGYYDVAREFGEKIGRLAAHSAFARMAIITGGGPGIMEAANRGAFESRAPSIGLNIALPREQHPNAYISPDLCFQFHYFAIRKLHLLERAKAAVFFPGGYGTCDELFEVLTLLQTGKIEPLPVVLVGQAFWRRAFDVDFLVEEGMISEQDVKLFTFAETAEEICARIVDWYVRARSQENEKEENPCPECDADQV